MITNALEEFQSTGRPVITSMGDIAASGGVWVTTTSEEIWAEETTLTGSIGVYSIIQDISPLEKWAGFNNDGVSMTKAGDIYDLSRGMNEELNNSSDKTQKTSIKILLLKSPIIETWTLQKFLSLQVVEYGEVILLLN